MPHGHLGLGLDPYPGEAPDSAVVVVPAFLLLADGSSYLLLADAASKLVI